MTRAGKLLQVKCSVFLPTAISLALVSSARSHTAISHLREHALLQVMQGHAVPGQRPAVVGLGSPCKAPQARRQRMGLRRTAMAAIVWTMCLKGEHNICTGKCLHGGLTCLAITQRKSLEERDHICML